VGNECRVFIYVVSGRDVVAGLVPKIGKVQQRKMAEDDAAIDK
jgi:hypothetical protein